MMQGCQLLRIVCFEKPKIGFGTNIFCFWKFWLVKKKTNKQTKKRKQKNVAGLLKGTFGHTFVLLRTYIDEGDFVWYFDGREVHDTGDFVCVAREREKECLGQRLDSLSILESWQPCIMIADTNNGYVPHDSKDIGTAKCSNRPM